MSAETRKEKCKRWVDNEIFTADKIEKTYIDKRNYFVASSILSNICKQFEKNELRDNDMKYIDLIVYVMHRKIDNVKELLIKYNFNMKNSPEWFLPLFMALANYDPDMLKVLLNYGADPNKRSSLIEDNVNLTPFLYAITLPGIIFEDVGLGSMLVDLLEHGANIEERDDEGNTALLNMSYNIIPETISILLEYGANVNVKNIYNGDTPLHAIFINFSMFIFPKFEESVELLLKYGANPTIKNNKGETPLNIASSVFEKFKVFKKREKRYKFVEIVEKILNNGGNYEDLSEKLKQFVKIPKSAFQPSIKMDISKVKQKKGKIMNECEEWESRGRKYYPGTNKKMVKGKTPYKKYLEKCKSEQVEYIRDKIVQEMIQFLTQGRSEKGLKPYFKTEYTKIIADSKDIIDDMVKEARETNENIYLVEDKFFKDLLSKYDFYSVFRDKNIQRQSVIKDDKNDEFIKAIKYYDLKKIENLIEQNIDINKRYENGNTALMTAVSRGKFYLAKLLIENGADVNIVNDDGFSPLLLAISKSYIDIVKLLLKNGADINVVNTSKGGEDTAYSLALEKGNDILIDLLERHSDLVKSEVKQDNLLGFAHHTTIENFKNILETGSILTYPEAIKRNITLEGGYASIPPGEDFLLGQYPGVYVYPILHSDIGKTIKYLENDEVVLVLCKDLLDRRDFHYDPHNSNGYIYSDSHGYESFIKNFVNKNRRGSKTDEMIFHHSIPASYIKEVWIKNGNILSRLENDTIPVEVHETFPNNTYECKTNILPLKPIFCYEFDKYDRPYKKKGFTEKPSFYRKLAENCGIKAKEPINPKKLNQKVQDKVEDIWRCGIDNKNVHIPPFD